jgi:hypothetical protein
MHRRRIFPILAVFALFIGGSVLFLSAKKALGEKAGCPCVDFAKATGDFESGQSTAYFDGKSISAPLAMLPGLSAQYQAVLGEQTGDEKWIEVSLSEQKLKAWEGDKLFMESLVSTGLWGKTPKGEFRIWAKFKYTKMSGGSKELHTYYYLPNVPYTMFFYNGFGLHGTYWHNNFGQPMSHGCVNLPTPMAEKLFYWASPTMGSDTNSMRASADNPGTRVVIHD